MHESRLRDKAVDLYTAEFESLRNEIFERFESQRQAFNYLFALLAAVMAFLAAVEINNAALFLKYILILPLIAAPLGFIFFDNEIIIWCITQYIHCQLKPRLSDLTGEDDLFQIEGRGSIYLLRSDDRLHTVLSTGRWLLFLLPLIVPIGYAFWVKLWQSQGELQLLFDFLIAADCVVTGIMIWAIYRTVKMRQDCSHCRRYYRSDR